MPKVDSINFVHSGRNLLFKGNETFSNFKSAQQSSTQKSMPQMATVTPTTLPSAPRKSYVKDMVNIIPDSYADEIVGAGLLIGAAVFSIRNFSKLKTAMQKLIDKNTSFGETIDGLQSKMSKFISVPDGIDAGKAQQALQEVANGKFATSAAIEGVRSSLQVSMDRISAKNTQPVIINGITANPETIPYKLFTTDDVNGVRLTLADPRSPIGLYTPNIENMNREMHQQSLLSLLGLRKANTPVDDPFIRIASVELKPFTSVGGLATVPKEIAEELPKIANAKNGARFMLDTPMYQGMLKSDTTARLMIKQDGSYVYRINTPKGIQNYNVELVDKIDVPIVGEQTQRVRIFQCDTTKQTDPEALKALGALQKPFDENLKAIFTPEQLQKIESILSAGRVFDANGYKIFKNETGETVFQPKIIYNLWENEKFNLELPQTAAIKNNYSDSSKTSGELDRFVFFSKYIYEHTIGMFTQRDGGRIYKDGKAILGADAFMLNDWHTGPLAALFRLGTIAKKYQQGLNETVAQKATNMPILSLLHNTYDKQNGDPNVISRLFNIMFGENAIKTVTQAYMPDIATGGKPGFAKQLLNGLMYDKAISPLKMLITYSDSIHPVSAGYGNECLKYATIGKDLMPLYRLRARDGFSASEISAIITNNNLGEEYSRLSEANLMRKTFYGITNGSNKQNNILTDKQIDAVIRDFYESILKHNPNAVRPQLIAYTKELETSPQKAFEWKMHNKKQILELFKSEIDYARQHGEMKWPSSIIPDKRNWGEAHPWLCQNTDLTGVTEKTPIFVSSGRITTQKGYETYMKGALKYLLNLGDDITKKEVPVFMIQGPIGYDGYAQSVVDCVNNVKNRLFEEANKYSGARAEALRKAAKRIVLLDEGKGGRYNVTKLLTDVNIMSSNYEPCGLTHKEFGVMSGGIVVGNNTGGIPSGLNTAGSKCYIGVDFNPEHGKALSEVVQGQTHPDPDFEIRATNFAKGIAEAARRWYDQIDGRSNEFAEGVAEMLSKDFTWAKPNNSGFQYIDALKNIGVLR